MSLKDEFKATGRTDQYLAEKVGISRAHVAHIKLGTRRPSLKVALALSKETKIPVSRFLMEA